MRRDPLELLAGTVALLLLLPIAIVAEGILRAWRLLRGLLRRAGRRKWPAVSRRHAVRGL